MNRPLIVAHRGDSAHAPENTLAAFRMAIEKGAEGLEFDVQLSADGVPVVIHDHDLRRTGMRSENVSELTAKQLGETDVGTWFNKKHPAFADPAFANERVPTLAAVLRSLEEFDGLIYVELKSADSKVNELAAAVCKEIESFHRQDQVIVKSFKLGLLPIVGHILPSIPRCALFAPEIMHYLRRREHMIAIAREFSADQISVHYSLVTPKLCELAAATGMPLTVWTVDDPRWLARRRTLEIRALITNDPAKFTSGK